MKTLIELCEARREKPTHYLSNRNPQGWSYQKCGRKAVTKSQFGKLLCAKCAAANLVDCASLTYHLRDAKAALDKLTKDSVDKTMSTE